MTALVFVDTNVLLYAVDADDSEAAKSAIAYDILGRPDLALSAQVLQEFYWQATRSTRRGALTHDQARLLIESLDRYPIQHVDLGLVLAALAVKLRYGLSYWDAAIIAAAKALGCRELLSEDLADGQDYDGVVVRNPFGSAR